MENDEMIKEKIVVELAPLVSILLLAYNHIDYTKLCVASLYRFTSHINFELITINNGSSDGTEEFFSTLSNDKKINFACNVGGDTAINAGLQLATGKYTLFLSNDLELTPHWLDNLLFCMESAENIGMVVPACSASSNYQQVDLPYQNREEMLAMAKEYNVSNPLLWEERIRLITYTFLIPTELFKDLGGFAEIYNPGGFDDDDLSFRIRRAGYKLVFAKDTFVHHYGSITINTDYEKQNLLARNRWIFFQKFGVDAWEDCTIDLEMIDLITCGKRQHKDILVLCSSCGGTLLQAKNKFRKQGLEDITWWTVTEKANYVPDLKTVSDYVVYGQFKNIKTIAQGITFDNIILDIDLQEIDNPQEFLQDLTSLLTAEGQLLFAAANEVFYWNVINVLNGNILCPEHAISQGKFNLEKLYYFLEDQGFADLQISYSKVSIPPEHSSLVENLKDTSLVVDKNILAQLYGTKRVVISAQGKGKMKNILLYPGYDRWLHDVVFNDPTIGNFLGNDPRENMWMVLRQRCEKTGYRVRTIDQGSIKQANYIIFADIPKSYDNPFFKNCYQEVYKGAKFFAEWQRGKGLSPLVFILLEPPFVMPENYEVSFHEQAQIIFTYLDELVDNQKYFKYYYPQPLPVHNPYTVDYIDKKMLTLIAGNKHSTVAQELYSERRRGIEYFEGQQGDIFHLYGACWEQAGYRCYKGQSSGKLATLSQYKYCLCYENGAANGYITEKIFDCFFAGCVPIYLGAPNITSYIPATTFIDGRSFASYEALHDHLLRIDEKAYQQYLQCSEEFLHSEAFEKFTYGSFAANIIRVLQKIGNNG